jgi:Pyruvate/2-oxoacid:ferredoxin oxidoreductase delta subunit
MAHLVHPSGYHDLVGRLNRFPQGAPPSERLYQILKTLFSDREAHLVARLPIRVFSVEKAARAWGLDPAAARKTLDDLCDKALLVDFEHNGGTRYCLPPPMAGFFEFSMMRLRGDIDQKALAEMLYRYINVEEDFAKALFARGQTQLGRVFVKEDQVPESLTLEVLDYERATHVIRTAAPIAVGLCYCRHKMAHLGRACSAPQDICMTFNLVGSSLIRHGHARRIDTAEALDVLQRAHGHHLVQFGENVRQEVNFICNCCKCCCEAMIAARKFALYHPVHSAPYLPRIAADRCTGCNQCVTLCPVNAIVLATASDGRPDHRKNATLDAEICLGCGVCARACPAGAITLVARPRRVITPLNTAHRVVLMAIERNTLQHVLLNNQALAGYRVWAAVLGVILKLPPVKRMLAVRQLRSRYLERLVQRLHWQPPSNALEDLNDNQDSMHFRS